MHPAAIAAIIVGAVVAAFIVGFAVVAITNSRLNALLPRLPPGPVGQQGQTYSARCAVTPTVNGAQPRAVVTNTGSQPMTVGFVGLVVFSPSGAEVTSMDAFGQHADTIIAPGASATFTGNAGHPLPRADTCRVETLS
jgi:hypothetical protein